MLQILREWFDNLVELGPVYSRALYVQHTGPLLRGYNYTTYT